MRTRCGSHCRHWRHVQEDLPQQQRCKVVQFLWKFEQEEDISVIQSDCLPFGDGPSPCIAISTWHQTAEEHGEPESEAVETIKNEMHVDGTSLGQDSIGLVAPLGTSVG